MDVSMTSQSISNNSTMDVFMISQSISNILQWTNSLKPLPNRLSGIDIHNLENSLQQINDKIKQRKYYMWYQEVKDVVIDLNNLMKDLCYKEIRSVSTNLFARTGLNIRNRSQIKTAILQVNKATEELKHLLNEERTVGEKTVEKISLAIENRKSACKDFEKSTEHVAVGREREKKEIIDQLLKTNNSGAVPVVIVIVGVPGIGKTKLARLVCKDEQVRANFGLQPIWITCLHETFDVESVANRVTASHHENRILVIIDDLRTKIIKHDYLEKLQKKLMEVADGRADAAIIITTRSNHVCNNTAATHVLRLQGLNQEDSWSLFQQIHGPITSTRKEQRTTEPEPHGEITRDCDGVPLLILIVAAAMNEQRIHGGGWIRFALEKMKKIYYHDLPTYQKLCFEFCSLFPEDYLIESERLIQLWTAEGFLTIPEQQFGRDCFNDFVPLFFHQVEEENNHRQYHGVVRNIMNNYVYRMNGLMHKLARYVATTLRGKNIAVGLMGEGVHSYLTLRVSLNFALDLSCEIPDSVFEKVHKLRTLLLPYNTNNPRLPHKVNMTTSTCDKIFNTFKLSLRLLDLHDLGIKMVPISIGEVKCLRYLDLSHNNIKRLPSCITSLIHLQTLKLSQCHVLEELPKDIEDLSCLNHLDIEGCLNLTHMPSGINKLTSLQTLSLFVASKKHLTGGLRSLADLNNLRGHLEISHLEQVKFSPSKAADKDDFFKNKQHLEFLTLRWDHEEESDVDIDDKFIDCLEPHWNLKVLLVVGYHGRTLSNWITSLQCLVKFTLNDCPKCQFLPPIDQLPNLKVLQLLNLDSMKFIAKTFQANIPIFFPSLKELTISDCPNLESWWENDNGRNPGKIYFSCISKLNIQYVPKLSVMPLYPGLDDELVVVESSLRPLLKTQNKSVDGEFIRYSQSLSKLKSMVIEHNNNLDVIFIKFENFISLEEVHIRDCYYVEYLPRGFMFLSSLKSLSIERCELLDLNRNEYISDGEGLKWEGLINLRSLTLRSIPKLESFPLGVENVNTLQDLRIYDCHGLTYLPKTIDKLTSLRQLVISECRSLGYLPKGMENMKSLHTLSITNCPLLLPRCQPDTGDDWPQIAHISNILVKKTPQEGL